jgi:hypothetical protein
MDHLFDREYERLKTELERNSKALVRSSNFSALETHYPTSLQLKSTNDTATDNRISKGECILELASLGIRVTTAICEAPALNFLKPAVGIAGVICDMARVSVHHFLSSSFSFNASR